MATLTKGTTFASGDVVTPAKLNNLVDAAAVSNIVTTDLANSSVTTAKIADSNVTTAKIADSNVTTAKIADSNVTTAKIANGAVTSTKLGNDIIFVPAGAVMPFAMNSAPNGWLAANGAAVSRTTYAGLFTAIGTTYGTGDGSTTFNLPDLRGYFIRGSGTNSDGTASAAFGVKQGDAFQSHGHNVYSDSTNRAGFASNSGSGYTGVKPNTGTVYAGGADEALEALGLVTFGGGVPKTASETRPANIALLYCIKF